MREKKELELYVHIPFCIRKCAYCDFLSGPADENTRASYVDALVREILSNRDTFSDYRVSTVFMGGGTPSVLEGAQTARIFHALRESFDIEEEAEITIEANPGTVTEDKLDVWKKCGINRLSIGLQSADDRELAMLGRIHTYREFLETCEMARQKGFFNINVDLISAIPGQTVQSWKRTLETVAALGPEHISAYSLIIEEGTLFYERYGEEGQYAKETAGQETRLRNLPPLPDEEEDRLIYSMTREILKDYGYHRYEISNYAREGYECRHNLGYWERKEYLGLGLGSSSLVGEKRFHNTADMKKYMQAPASAEIREEIQELSVQDRMEEYMFLGLRKMEGISAADFARTFQTDIDAVYGEQLRKLREEGLLERKNGRICLTDRGIDISNYVFSEFIL